jgi:hypothetical protein
MMRTRLLIALRSYGILATLGIVVSIGTADAAVTNQDKSATYQIKNTNNPNAKAYAVFVDVAAKNIDTTKSAGKILKAVRLEERFGVGNPPPLIGTLIVFEDNVGIPKGGTDDIQIHFKDLPKTKKDVKFSTISTLRSGTGRDGTVIEEEVPRIGFAVVKDPIYSILNDNTNPFSPDPNNPDPVPITVDNLQYLSNVPEASDPTLYLDLENSYGFTSLGLGPMTIPGLTESPPIDVPGPVDLGNWIYVRGIMTIDHANGSGEISTYQIPFVHGHMEYVPEPSTAILLGAGLASCCMVLSRPKRSDYLTR